MKIIGIAMVRDEADVIRLSVRHHLALGLDGVLVVDNGSSDDTPRLLEQMRRGDDRIEWSADAGPYHQAEILTALAREAVRRGADWVLPFDADEFWWVRGGDLRAVLAGSPAGALRAPVVNFVQRRDQIVRSEAALLTMTRRVATPLNRRQLREQDPMLARRIPYVELSYQPKCVSRPTAAIEIGRGNHFVDGVAGPTTKTTKFICLHAPLRSRAGLELKAAAGARIEQAGWNGGWQARRWRRLQEQGKLDREWAANSYVGEALDVGGNERSLVVDVTLRDLVAPLL